MARCLVVEDETDMAEYISTGLKESGHVVTLAVNGVDGMFLAMTEDWDAIVLDRMLPGGMDGLKIVEALRAMGKGTPVLILSALAGSDERVKGLRTGSDDYLTKPFAFAELLARVEALLRRPALREEVSELRVGDLRLDLRARKASRGNNTIILQPREFRLLEFLVRNQGQVVTRTMLLESVWDYHFDPLTGVIDVQISRLRQKLGSPPLIHTVRGAGYMIHADA